jgi:hypothetical protein
MGLDCRTWLAMLSHPSLSIADSWPVEMTARYCGRGRTGKRGNEKPVTQRNVVRSVSRREHRHFVSDYVYKSLQAA